MIVMVMMIVLTECLLGAQVPGLLLSLFMGEE